MSTAQEPKDLQTGSAFRWDVPDTFNYAVDVVDAYCARDPHRLALVALDAVGTERRFSYAQVSDLSKRLAAALGSRGVRKGDRVAVVLPRIPEWQLAMLACARLGAIAIPCIEMLTAKDLAYRIAHSGATAAITTVANTSKLEALPLALRVSVDAPAGWLDFWELARCDASGFSTAVVAADDPAVLYYTSGSTGHPKGVLHAARALFAWRVSAQYWQGLREDDVMWCTADTGWSKAGTGILYAPWSCGCTVFFYNGPFEPTRRLDLIARYGVTVFCASATEFRHLVAQDLSRFHAPALRLCASAGEAVNPEVIRRWEQATGARLLEAYGQTETLMVASNRLGDPTRAGTMGRALPGSELVVLDEGGQRLAAGETGQLALRLPNPQHMLGYYRDPGRTQASMLSADDCDWWLTGDMVRMDGEGFIYYEGRADDIISSAGYRIGPFEVESVLQEHAAVLESAAVAAPDAERGEVVKAYVVLKPGYEASAALASELQEHAKRTTAPYKYPRRIEFVAELPKGPTGKILRRQLRDREFARTVV